MKLWVRVALFALALGPSAPASAQVDLPPLPVYELFDALCDQVEPLLGLQGCEATCGIFQTDRCRICCLPGQQPNCRCEGSGAARCTCE